MRQSDGQPMVRPNDDPFKRSFLVAGLLVLAAPFVRLLVGGPATAEELGAAIGFVLVPAVVAALLSGLAARRSSREWPWWAYALAVVSLTLLLVVLSALGRVDSTS